jgi:carbonic anhydrase
MRLFQAILEANNQALSGDSKAGIRPEEFADSLPVVVLTCIDPRLNRLMPEVLGIPEEQFIWLRNAGNIIFDSLSSMTRTLALACAVKGGKEIAIIGHTDCRVRKTSMVELTDRFRALGIERSRLPDNLNEFFGLFASERQNVMRGVEFVRQSPLIGPRVPVHGLLVDTDTGKLEWIVNGYEVLERTAPQLSGAKVAEPTPALPSLAAMPEFQIGEMKFPEFQIGAGAEKKEMPSFQEPIAARSTPPTPPNPPVPKAETKKEPVRKFDPKALFKIIGADKKIYGPVSGEELEKWIAEGRVRLDTLAQRVGYKNWKQLSEFVYHIAEVVEEIPLPPRLKRQIDRFKGDKS